MKKALFIFIFSIIILSSFAMAASPPNPMSFKGEIIYNENIPSGYYITAKIGNSIHGQCLIIDNKYGYGQNSCIVVSDEDNVLVHFYIGNTLIGNHSFNSLDIIELNFTLNSIPPRPEPLSNSICEPSLDECSFNFLDCHVSLTNLCDTSNNICDSNVGETCSNTPGDCGACPSTSSGGSSSGGGGGGGGGGSSITTTNTVTLSDNSGSGGAVDETEGKESETEVNSEGKKGFTGRVVDGLTKTTGGKIALVVLALIILGLIFVSVKKKSKK